MTLDQIINVIKKRLKEHLDSKAPKKVIFEVNVNQGGIGDCKEMVESKLK